MNRVKLFVISIIAGLALQSGLAAPALPLPSLFPELPGWQKQGKAETFLPETLYEHINGAAENFLGYDFEQLAVQNYGNDQKQTMIAEIYFHGRPGKRLRDLQFRKTAGRRLFPHRQPGLCRGGSAEFFLRCLLCQAEQLRPRPARQAGSDGPGRKYRRRHRRQECLCRKCWPPSRPRERSPMANATSCTISWATIFSIRLLRPTTNSRE